MKNILLTVGLLFVVLFYCCGPAAENRQYMHERAKVFQDSIATFIRNSIAEAEAPAMPQQVIVAPQPAQQTTPAPANSGQPK